MPVVRVVLIVFLIAFSFVSHAQTQLVLLRRENVIARYKEGSLITYKLKHSDEYMTRVIEGVTEFTFITGFDTIPFNKIERISLKGQPNKSLFNLFGSFIFVAGVAYYGFDEVNSIVVHGQGYDNDPAVWKPTLVMVAVGLVMKQIHRRTQRVRFPAKLHAASYGSPFYKSDQ